MQKVARSRVKDRTQTLSILQRLVKGVD